MSFRSASSAANTASPVTVTKPTGTASGDRLIAYVARRGGSTSTTSPPDGSWTAIGSEYNHTTAVSRDIFEKTAGGSEPTTYTFTHDGLGTDDIAVVLIADTTTAVPSEVGLGNAQGNSGATWTAPTFNPTEEPGDYHAMFAGAGGATTWITTPPSGYTLAAAASSRVGTGSASFVAIAVYYKAYTGTGASGTAVLVTGLSVNWIATHLAIKHEAAGGGGVTGTGASTDRRDELAGTGSLTIAGTAAPAEQPDSIAASGGLTIAGTGAVAEAPDTTAGTGATTVAGSGAVTDQPDTVAGTGAGDIPVTGSGAVAERADSIAGAGSLALAGAGAVADRRDTVAGSGAVFVSFGAVVERADTMAASGSLTITGLGAVTDRVDLIAGYEVEPLPPFIPRGSVASIAVPTLPGATVTVPVPVASVAVPELPTAEVS